MTPQDTHHDSLQVYLEDNNFSTEELREFLTLMHWVFEYKYYGVGTISFHSVGSAAVSTVDVGANTINTVSSRNCNYVGTVGN